jgi:hypothetical protein
LPLKLFPAFAAKNGNFFLPARRARPRPTRRWARRGLHNTHTGERGAFPAACPETAPRHLENEGATSEMGAGSAHSSSSRVAGGHGGRQRPPRGFSAGKMCVSQPAARFLRGVVVFDLRRGHELSTCIPLTNPGSRDYPGRDAF